MYYYKSNDKYFFSQFKYASLNEINEVAIKDTDEIIYYLNKLDINKSRFSFSITHSSLLFIKDENIDLLCKDYSHNELPSWILKKIEERKVKSINTNYPNWLNRIYSNTEDKWKVNIFALGDVGGMLLTGLRLIGGKSISEIGIYDRSLEKMKRYEYEMNQVLSAFDDENYPKVHTLSYDDLFDCDMFVFCASKGVPPVGSTTKDVRMVQFEENSKIISEYARLAREKDFKGVFAVVSDPVDPLCKVVYLESNKDNNGLLDYNGLFPEQIRGYGLGVMNARAIYYSKKDKKTSNYNIEGRAYGPHGDGLIIANSITNYDDELSDYLTNKAKKANLEVRKVGFKPFIAPALSSGSLSIISTINGDFHYSATYIGGVYMGCKNRLNNCGTEIEMLDLPIKLKEKLKNTHERLSEII